MGDVILFAPRRRPGQSRRREGESTEAEIVFFTGVRYQRMNDAETGGRPAGGVGGKRKRKRG